jgi:beta-1,4-mannosyltransferase
MQGTLRGFDAFPGAVTDDAVAALRALEAGGTDGAGAASGSGSGEAHPEARPGASRPEARPDANRPDPLVLGYHLVARTNPYQRLLYQAAWDQGLAPVPVSRAPAIDELTALARLGFPMALHLHWTSRILEGTTTAAEAAAAASGFLDQLDAFRDAGGRLAWTVHNILPHGAEMEDEEARLQAGIVERSDVVHVLAAATPELVAPWFTIPGEKVLHVPHPSYAGAYADMVTRGQARHDLGLGADELVFVVMGAIRAYKGLGGLLDALDAAPPDRPWRLVVAGQPSDEPGVDEVLDRAILHPRVALHARRIPPDEMQLFLRAADIEVLPYVRSLNSGVLMLALTFGLPVVVPAGGGLAELVDSSFARTFEPGDPASLRDALAASVELLTPAARAAATAVADAHAPGPLSERFARGLRARMRMPDGT